MHFLYNGCRKLLYEEGMQQQMLQDIDFCGGLVSMIWIVFPGIFCAVAMTVILGCQTYEDRKRREQGLPRKKHHNIKDLNIMDVYVHKKDD